MKKRKQYQGEVDKVETAVMNLETQIVQIESANVNRQIFEGLEKANKINTALNAGITSEKIADLQDNIAEQAMLKNEMDALLMATVCEDDEDELMGELEELDREDAYCNMPKVPTHAVGDEEPVVVADPEPERQASHGAVRSSEEDIS